MLSDTQEKILAMNEANIFLSRFINNENAYALQTSSGSYTAYRQRRITPELLAQHLYGDVTIGTYAVNPINNTSRFLCFDSDEESEESFAKLISWFDSFGIPSYRESRRPGRSGHLWVVLEESIASIDAFKILSFGKFCYKFKGEIFPHSEKLLTPDKLGLLVRLPLGVHRKLLPERRIGLFEACPNTDVQDQLAWFVKQPVASLESINRLLQTIPVTKPVTVKKCGTKQNSPILDEFPEDWEWTPKGSELQGPCPKCREDLHDRSGDNLYVNPETNVLYCFYSGGSHSFKQILTAARHFKSGI